MYKCIYEAYKVSPGPLILFVSSFCFKPKVEMKFLFLASSFVASSKSSREFG